MVKSVTHASTRALLILLLLLGAGVRFLDFGKLPPGLYHDEAQNGMDALEVLSGHFAIFFEENNGREPLFIYCAAISIGIFGRTPFAVRLPSFYAGFLTLAVTYSLARAMFNRRIALYTLAVLTFTFWHIHLSRIAFRASFLPLFMGLYLTLITRAIKYRKNIYWILGGLIYGLSWYTYVAARFTPAAIALCFLYSFIIRQTSHDFFSKKQIWVAFISFMLAALVVLSPLGIFTLKSPEIIFSRSGQVSIFNKEINGGNLGGTLLRHFLRTIGMFTFRGDRIWRHNLAYRPVWQLGLSLSFLIGLGVAVAYFRRKPAMALTVMWTAVMLVPTLLAEDAPHFLRAVGVLPTAALLPAFGLNWIYEQLNCRFICGPVMVRHPRLCHLIPTGTTWLLVASSALFSTYDYMITYAQSPLVYHWFEGGPVEMAEAINTFTGKGWDGHTIVKGTDKERTVCIDELLWSSWTAVPFLVPENVVCLSPAKNLTQRDGFVMVVWPYSEWRQSILPVLPHPTYLTVLKGPDAQGDLDPEPYTIALYVIADPVPPVPMHTAQFENGIGLRAALVEPHPGGVYINLWWDTNVKQNSPSTVFIHYFRDGKNIAQHDGQPALGELPTTFWFPGDLILDKHFIPKIVPDVTSDTLHIGLYDSESGVTTSMIQKVPSSGPWLEMPVILEP